MKMGSPHSQRGVIHHSQSKTDADYGGLASSIHRFNFPVAETNLIILTAILSNIYYVDYRKGYADTEIEALFAKYDTDGDRILDPEEQKCLAEDLLKQKDSLNAEYAKIQKGAEDGKAPAALADLMVS